MTKLRKGDSITCRVSSAEIVGPYKSYDEICSFVIIATDDHGYFLFVPNYMFIKNTSIVDKYRCKNLGIENRFLGEEMIYISESLVAAVDRQEGLRCRICNEMYPWAQPNQPDGKTLICFGCRQNPWR